MLKQTKFQDNNQWFGKHVYTSPTSTIDTFLEFLGQDLQNPLYKGLISEVIFTPYP